MPGSWRLARSVLAAALLAGLVLPLAAAQADLSVDVVYAPTNKGLMPHRLGAYGRVHYYQLATNPKGTLVILHGCSRSARAFFPYDPVNCPECLGFPEHVSHTKQALAAGYTVLALEPQDKRFLCWSSANRGSYRDDRPKVITAVTRFLVRFGLTDKPVYLLGVSSGGTMALKLMSAINEQAAQNGVRLGDAPNGEKPFVLQIHGIISEESAPQDFLAADEEGHLKFAYFPPTLFITMERGKSLLSAPDNIGFLRRNGVQSNMIVSPSRRVSPTFFSDRCPVISSEQSASLVEGMQRIGMLDEDGWLLGDPDSTIKNQDPSSPMHDWPARLSAALPWLRPDSHTTSLMFRRSLIQQALNVAWGYHEAVSDYLTACLAWLESRGQAALPELLQRYTVPGGNLSALTIHGIVTPDSGPTDSTTPADAPAAGPTPAPAAGVAEAPAEQAAEAPAAELAEAPAPGLAPAPVTLAELEEQISIVQQLLGQLAAAGVQLDTPTGEHSQTVGVVQMALAELQQGRGSVAAAASTAGTAGVPVGEQLQRVLSQLGHLVQQLKEEGAV